MWKTEKCEMFIEGDGETDQYGLRITGGGRSFMVKGLSRKQMNYHLKDLVDQFLSLTSCFDEMSNDKLEPCFSCMESDKDRAFWEPSQFKEKEEE